MNDTEYKRGTEYNRHLKDFVNNQIKKWLNVYQQGQIKNDERITNKVEHTESPFVVVVLIFE